jgi:TolB-like protein/Tfp pilus assembly protein PilF
MKRCPECRRNYSDETLNYCLDDGTPLVDGPGDLSSTANASSEAATVVLRGTSAVREGQVPSEIDARSKPEHSNTIAVLPFANLSNSDDSNYFSDGLAEELLNVLSKINGLRVAARTSAFAFKGKQASVRDIGKELNVSSILEGSVRIAGEHVRIAVQLVDVENSFHLWSETYDRTMDDIFAIQDDIAHSVVGELRDRLMGIGTDKDARINVADEVARATKGRPADPEAQRLMLLGRYLLERSNEADAAKAVRYFDQALEIDPTYAICWAHLGRAFLLASSFGWHSLDIEYKKAEEALKKALDLEPDMAEGHARLGMVRWKRDGDVREAEQSIGRALALGPQNIDVLAAASVMAREFARFEDALRYGMRITEIDPLNPGGWAVVANASSYAGDYALAETAIRRALDIAPERTAAHANLGLILLGQGRVDEALDAASLEPEDSPWRPWSLAIIQHAAGRVPESDAELTRLVEQFGKIAPFQIAEVHAKRGETSEAFHWLDRTIADRDPGRFTAKGSALLNPLHQDPRWVPLLKRIGFPD